MKRNVKKIVEPNRPPPMVFGSGTSSALASKPREIVPIHSQKAKASPLNQRSNSLYTEKTNKNYLKSPSLPPLVEKVQKGEEKGDKEAVESPKQEETVESEDVLENSVLDYFIILDLPELGWF